MEFIGQLTHMHTSPGGTGTKRNYHYFYCIWGNTSNGTLQLGCSSWKEVSVIAGGTCCSYFYFFFSPGSPALTAALEPSKVVSKRQRGAREPQKSAATWPENWQVSVRCHHRLLNKENRSSSGMLIQLVLNHLTLKSGDTHIALSKAQLQHKTAHFHHSFSLSVPHLFHRITEVGKDL